MARQLGELIESVHELIFMDSVSALRWFQHDYPHPLARWHHHPEIEIHLITDSTGTAQIGDAARAFGPGAFYLLGSGLPHNWVSSMKPGGSVRGRDMLIQVHPDLLLGLAGKVPDLGALPRLLAEGRRGIQYFGETRERAETLLRGMEHKREMLRFAGFLELMDLLATAPREDRQSVSEHEVEAPLNTGDTHVFDRALAFIHEHLKEPCTLADVAAQLCMSPSHLSRLFSRATGIGYSRTVNRLRISEACRLLLLTELPVSAVCHKAGFTNQSNFNRRFREETGMTPRQYRAADTVR